jgi:4-hydroxythreonine-4-phosphate dehydrogenase
MPPATAAIAVTMGEPAGIAGEITLKAWQALRGEGPAFFVIGDPDHLDAAARALGLSMRVARIDEPEDAPARFHDALPVLPERLSVPSIPGQPDARNARHVVRAIDRAVEFVKSGRASSLVTNPIHKGVLYETGFRHPGHTEYLAHLAGGAAQPVMMLACRELRVVPVTVHLSLADAVRALDRASIIRCTEITAAALVRDFGIKEPVLAIAGLNPHAGEGGHLGKEEIDIIAPAVAALRAKGLHVKGPAPADTLFHARARAASDAVICMYHDQALIPLKTIDFEGGINVTLGLPFVRTSPDHGTAFDIAGRGIASETSLVQAIRLAASMADRRRTAAASSTAA